ncbi:hypothetical protein BST11_26585 [Mycobacterium alsense]|uniref:Uncharacterized protein n=1 Tax=Mycobacterium alsense TaxID=324058 RepID=A0ABX3R178_9MYCO|nr:hypothetical protein BST11_26585 [Mycobacterium alsense]
MGAVGQRFIAGRPRNPIGLAIQIGYLMGQHGANQPDRLIAEESSRRPMGRGEDLPKLTVGIHFHGLA